MDIGDEEIKLTPEQKQWYEIGFMAGYGKALFEQKKEIIKKIDDIKR